MMDEIEMAQSLKFSNYSCRLSDRSMIVDKKNKYICYECGGNQKSSKQCLTCKGSKMVDSENPLVSLLTDLTACKLNMKVTPSQLPQIRETLKPHCSQIKEQSYLADDKFIYCDVCQIQEIDEVTNFMSCKQCKHYYICNNCFQSHNYTHDHQLSKYCVSQSSFSEEDQEEEVQVKKCHNCAEEIEDRGIYLTCENCRENGLMYSICSQCSDKKKYKHSNVHIFKPSLYRKPNNTKNEMIEKNPFTDDNWVEENGVYHDSQIYVDQDSDEEFRSETKQMKNTSIVKNYLNVPRYSEPIQSNRSFSPEKNQVASRVKVMIDETDSEMSQKLINSKNIMNPQEIEVVEEEYVQTQDFQSSQSEGQPNFIFQNYQCDQCGNNPKKVRYHCNQCQDFDLCSKCHELNKKISFHMHSKFHKITGQEQKIANQMQQRQKQERFNLVISKLGNLRNTLGRKSMF